MKRSTLIFILVLVAALVLIKVIFLSEDKTGSARKGMGPNQAPSPVIGYVATPENLKNKILATGSVLSNEEVELRAEITGKIQKVSFKEGSEVSAGDILIKIDDTDLQAQLKKAESQLNLAKEREERHKKLLEINGISREEYETTLNNLTSIKADIQVLRVQVSKTEIRAPFNGVVGLRYISEGSLVLPTTLIASVQQIDPVKIDFSIPEKYIGLVKKGDAVNYAISGLDELFKATIYAIEPKIDPQTRSILVRARSENSNKKIFPGSFARIELISGENEKALMIPSEALIPELKGYKVFLYRGGKAQPQKVEVGLRSDVKVEITKGIQAGDTVITTGIMQLKPNAPVKLKELTK